MAARGYVTSPEIPLYMMCVHVCLLYVNLQYVSVHTLTCVQCHQQGGVSHAQMSHWHIVSVCYRAKMLLDSSSSQNQASKCIKMLNSCCKLTPFPIMHPQSLSSHDYTKNVWPNFQPVMAEKHAISISMHLTKHFLQFHVPLYNTFFFFRNIPYSNKQAFKLPIKKSSFRKTSFVLFVFFLEKKTLVGVPGTDVGVVR